MSKVNKLAAMWEKKIEESGADVEPEIVLPEGIPVIERKFERPLERPEKTLIRLQEQEHGEIGRHQVHLANPSQPFKVKQKFEKKKDEVQQEKKQEKEPEHSQQQGQEALEMEKEKEKEQEKRHEEAHENKPEEDGVKEPSILKPKQARIPEVNPQQQTLNSNIPKNTTSTQKLEVPRSLKDSSKHVKSVKQLKLQWEAAALADHDSQKQYAKPAKLIIPRDQPKLIIKAEKREVREPQMESKEVEAIEPQKPLEVSEEQSLQEPTESDSKAQKEQQAIDSEKIQEPKEQDAREQLAVESAKYEQRKAEVEQGLSANKNKPQQQQHKPEDVSNDEPNGQEPIRNIELEQSNQNQPEQKTQKEEIPLEESNEKQDNEEQDEKAEEIQDSVEENQISPENIPKLDDDLEKKEEKGPEQVNKQQEAQQTQQEKNQPQKDEQSEEILESVVIRKFSHSSDQSSEENQIEKQLKKGIVHPENTTIHRPNLPTVHIIDTDSLAIGDSSGSPDEVTRAVKLEVVEQNQADKKKQIPHEPGSTRKKPNGKKRTPKFQDL